MTCTKPFLADQPKLSTPPLKWLVLSIMIGSLAGCQHEITDPPFEKKTYELDHQSSVFTVHFKGPNGAIKTQEFYELQELLHPGGIGKVSVHVTLPVPKNPQQEQKILGIKKTLIKSGLNENRIHIKSRSLTMGANSMDIGLDTYRAIPPVCGDWHFPLGEARGAMIYPNYGCSDIRNFILMLEDPKVLWQGNRGAPQDTNRDIQSLRDYKSGKPLTLNSESADNSTQDSGNGQKSSNNG